MSKEPTTLATVMIPAGTLRPDSCVVVRGHLESTDEVLELPTVPIVVIDSVQIAEAEESE